MSNKEKKDDISRHMMGFSTPMPKYEYQKLEISRAEPSGISEGMFKEKDDKPYTIPPPPKLGAS